MARKAQWPPPVYPRDGMDRLRIYVNGKPKDFTLGPTGSNEARAEYARLVAELAAGRRIGTNGTQAAVLTVDDVVQRWLTQGVAEKYSATSREPAQFVIALRPLCRIYGHTLAAEFDPERLEVLQHAMATGSWMSNEERAAATKRKRPVGLCRNVVNRRITRVKTAWRWLEKKKLVPAGSWSALLSVEGLAKNNRVSRNTEKVKPCEWAQVEAVVPFLKPPVAAMTQLQWWTGMRSCEVRIMRACEIDQAGVSVDGVKVWIYRPEKDKNSWREGAVPRAVPLGPECQKLLGPWLRAAGPGDYLFPPSRKKPNRCYSSNTYANAVLRACRAAGIKEFHPYQSRHAAKMRFKRAAGLDGARAVLGQSSVQTTELYGSLDIEHAAQVAAKLG
jgi:integrase